MKKSLLRLLAKETAQQKELSNQASQYLAQKLTRGDLRTYLFFLKKYIHENEVNVKTSIPASNQTMSQLKKLFPNKNVTFGTDSSLGGGIYIEDGDNLIYMNIKSAMESIIYEMNKTL